MRGWGAHGDEVADEAGDGSLRALPMGDVPPLLLLLGAYVPIRGRREEAEAGLVGFEPVADGKPPLAWPLLLLPACAFAKLSEVP